MITREMAEEHFNERRQLEQQQLDELSFNPHVAKFIKMRGILNRGWTGANPRPSLEYIADVYKHRLSLNGGNESTHSDLELDKVMELAGISTTPTAHKGRLSGQHNGACSEAEGYFDQTLEQLFEGEPMEQYLVSAFHDSSGNPIALRKERRSMISLSLVPLTADGIFVPAGSLITIDPTVHTEKSGSTKALMSYGRDYGYRYTTYEVEDELAFMPNRVSPWAYEDEMDRSLFGFQTDVIEDLGHNPERAWAAQTRTLEDFKQAAFRVMELCGQLEEASL